MAAAGVRVVLVTGASSGIGQACATLLAKRGLTVYGTSRYASGSGHPVSGQPVLIPMDVRDEGSVAAAVERVVSNEGRIDAVINNAGCGLAGPVEETTLSDAQTQFEVNFFGVLRVCRAVLPIMRRQRSGYIVNIGSIGGVIAIPFQSMYSASKFALEGLSESLRYEVAEFGIRVVLIEPGDHRTAFTQNRKTVQQLDQKSEYANTCSAAIARMEADEQNGPGAENVAALVDRVLRLSNPRLRYTTGPSAQRAAVWLKRLMPYRVVEAGVRSYYRLGEKSKP